MANERVNPFVDTMINENLLDNWDFRNPVNQKGAKQYTADAPGIDRWNYEGREDAPLTVEDGYLKTTSVMTQRMELSRFYKLCGKTVTLSALLRDGTLETGTVTLAEKYNMGEFYEIPLDGTDRLKMYWLGNIGAVQVARLYPGEYVAVKLEVGNKQTLAYQKDGKWELYETANYGKELLECQRYYVHSLPHTRCYLNNPCLFAVNLPIQMRAKPTIVGEIRAYKQWDNAYVPGVTVTVNEIRNNAVILQASGISEDCYLALNIDSFDANL